jgi:hypothetical protein
VENVLLAPLFYESDSDLLNEENRGVLEKAVKAALVHPEVQAACYGIQRSCCPVKIRLVLGYQTRRNGRQSTCRSGVPAVRIHLRCVGASYPLARPILDGAGKSCCCAAESPGRNHAGVSEPLAFPFQLLRPQLPDPAPGIGRLDEQSKGLVFRVEAAVTRQILTNDAIAMFSDVIIETQPKAGTYRYMAGCVPKFAEAIALKKNSPMPDFRTQE